MDHSNAIVYGSNVESWKKELDEMSLDEYMVAAVQKRFNDILFIDAITEQTLRVKEFLRKSYSLAAELQTLGCNKDTIIGIISENRLEYPVVILATLLTGATLTCYNAEYSLHEFQPIFNIVRPRVLFCSVACSDKVNKVIPDTCQVIAFDTDDSSDILPQHLRFSRLIQSTKMPSAVANKPNQTAFILYSSGTTGLPKGVMLTHKNWVFITKLQENNQIVKKNGSMFASSTLMCHVSGLEAALSAIIRDEVVIIMPKIDRRLFLSIIEKYKIKRALVLPAMIIFLLKDPAVDEYDLSSLEFLSYGGAPIKADIEIALKTKFSLKYVQQLYGMTETTTCTTRTSPTNRKVGSCGAPLPGTQIKIVHPQTGEILGKSEIGEMCSKGPHIMKGYYQNEKATAETIDEDGWLHSGDIAYYDDDGDFFIVDRAKELIKCGGSQVSPAELEALLLTHPSIVDAAVIGVPDENGIELPRAYVVKVNGSKITEEEVIQYIAGKALLPYKRLQGGVEFVSEIPKNATGKILRRKLRELWNKQRPNIFN